MALTPEQRTDLAKLYMATFDRAPDADGFGFWENELDTGGSLLDVARSMFVSDEAQDIYGGLGTEELVDTVYDNLLNRAPDQEGKDYWVGQLNDGAVSRAYFVEAVINGAEANDTEQGQKDAQLIEKKTAVAQSFVDENLNDLDEAKAIMDQVEAGKTVEEIQAELARYPVGETDTLTEGLDDLTGTAQNDLFRGQVEEGGTTTFESVDIIDGGGGDADALDVRILGSAPDASADGADDAQAPDIDTSPVIDNVEQIFLRNRGDGYVLDATDINGTEQFWLEDSTQNSLTGIVNLDSDALDNAAFGLDNAESYYYLGFNDAAVSGSDDAVDLVVTGGSEAEVAFGRTGGGYSTNGGIETANVESTGVSANAIAFQGDEDLSTVNVTGDQDLTLVTDVNVVGTVTTIDAGGGANSSAFTGDLDATFGGADSIDASGGVTFVGGEGDDVANMGNLDVANADASDSIDVSAGLGNDTVNLGTAVDGLSDDFDGTISLDGGDGAGDELTASVSADGDFGKLIGLDAVSIESIEASTLTVTGSGTLDFNMADLGSVTDFGFIGGSSGDTDVTADAGDLTEDFSLRIDGDLDKNTELGVTVNDIRDAQDSLELNLNGDNASEFTVSGSGDTSVDVGGATVSSSLSSSSANAENLAQKIGALASVRDVAVEDSTVTVFGAEGSDVSLSSSSNLDDSGTNDIATTDAGAAALNSAVADDGVTELTINSNAEAAPVSGLDEWANEVGAISSKDKDGNNVLQTLSVTAAANVAAASLAMAKGSQDSTDVFTFDLSGAGAADLGTDGAVETGEYTNEIAINNTGSGDRRINLDGNAGDLKAASGTNQAAGEGVTVSGDGSGTVFVKADDAVLNTLAIDGTGAGATVAAEVIESGSGDVDAANFSGVDQILLSDDILSSGEQTISNIAADTTVKITADQRPKTLTLEGADNSLSVALAGSGDLGSGVLDIDNVENLTVSADSGGDDTTYSVAFIDLVQEQPASPFVVSDMTLEAAADTTLDIGFVNLDTDTGSAFDFDVTLTGDGNVELDKVRDVDSAGSDDGIGTLSITADNGGTVDLGSGFNVTTNSMANEATVVGANSISDGTVDTLTETVTVDASGAGDTVTAGLAGENVTFTGATDAVNEGYFIANDTLDVTGGSEDDTFVFDETLSSGEEAEFTVTGNGGADQFNVNYDDALGGKYQLSITDWSNDDTSNINAVTVQKFDGATQASSLLQDAGVGSSITASDVDLVSFANDGDSDDDPTAVTYDGSTYALVGPYTAGLQYTGDASFGDGEILMEIQGVQLDSAQLEDFFVG